MVEIFFQELKQHLKIKFFIWINENEMWIKIWTEVILEYFLIGSLINRDY
jgi:hypothetical protein